MAICADAKRWSGLNFLSRYVQRDQIITAISRHEQNLTDCFHAFQIVTSITASNPVGRLGMIAFPGSSVSGRPLLAPRNALVGNLGYRQSNYVNSIFGPQFPSKDCATCSNIRRVGQCLSKSARLCKDD
ncbi:hypothetical protein BS47DRAFT_660473 [Hydnum rufescens UP504]|uniref:Uncharacterized protein n=1 Tax=Hydnum rufescens UP504 TaxID=1448309 RepID=A0A9P6DJD0_9AGAM|nr:hypothetical protein BS47DRAFT_660473 [Hydnum rufescens UP504]